MQVTVKPGDTANCDSSPCQVSLVMALGWGPYEVADNETKIVTCPAGQRVLLGGLWGSNAIKGVGANVPST